MSTQAIVDWMNSIPPLGVYTILFLSSFTENVFPPWPGDTLTVVGGFLAAQGQSDIGICFLSILLGNLAGAALMYYAGEHVIALFRHWHTKTSLPFLRRILEPLFREEHLEKARIWFGKWGIALVLFSRFSAGVRFFVSIVAGMVKMNFLLFLLCFSGGVLVWNSLLLWGGWQLQDKWDTIIDWLQLYNSVVIALLVVFLCLWLIRKWKRKWKRSSQSIG